MTTQKQIEAYRCNILIYKDINSIYDDKNVFVKISTKQREKLKKSSDLNIIQTNEISNTLPVCISISSLTLLKVNQM